MAKQIPVNILRRVSYSGLCSLHSCPRRFFLNKCVNSMASSDDIDMTDLSQVLSEKLDMEARKVETQQFKSVTFAYGHAVGAGVQAVLARKDWDEVVFEMFMQWGAPLWADDTKRNKSFAQAVIAVEGFASLRTIDFDIDDWELVILDSGRPATELSFLIELPNGASYIGFIDAVIRNRYTGEIAVLECKTTGKREVNAAMYCNSNQAVGYAVVLDKAFGAMSSYNVIYTPYLTMCDRWEVFQFPKTALQRATWIANTMTDIAFIDSCLANGHFPTYGEACQTWGESCKYLHTCLDDYSKFYVDDVHRVTEFDYVITADELIAAQQERMES